MSAAKKSPLSSASRNTKKSLKSWKISKIFARMTKQRLLGKLVSSWNKRSQKSAATASEIPDNYPAPGSELEAIASPSFEKVEEKLLSFRDNPRPPGCKKMKDREGAWRIRSGDYRIIYDINDSATTVTVVRVGHRKEIYR